MRKTFLPAPGKNNLVSHETNVTNRVACQICGRSSHQALDCFHRMDYAYQGRHPPSEFAAMVSQSNALHEDEGWLADSAVNNHITADLENLNIQQTYNGTEDVAIGNGSALPIAYISSSHFETPNSVVHLKNILHCPKAVANLVSINKFCHDNHCYFKLTDSYFLVKDNLTKEILLQGPSENGLYHMPLKKFIKKNQRTRVALLGVKIFVVVWHYRLDHPTVQVLTRLINKQHLPTSSL